MCLGRKHSFPGIEHVGYIRHFTFITPFAGPAFVSYFGPLEGFIW